MISTCGALTCVCDIVGKKTCRPTPKLYSTKQTPRGSVVVLGDEVVFEYEMSHKEAQEAADWLNHRKTA
jgi:hypothetical protein